MIEKEKDQKKESRRAQVRATISFPSDVYANLNIIAREKKVSFAWVIRDAADMYIAERRPHFEKA